MAKNVTVITQVASSRNLTNSIKYTNSKDPHHNDHGQIKNRNLKSWGINCSDDPQLAKAQMLKTLHDAHVGRHGVHDFKEVKSFKGLDYHNQHDRNKAVKLDIAMMKKEHPHCQIFCQLQADGKGHHLHVHNHICPRRYDNLKSITGKESSIRYYIKPISDKIMKDHNFGTLKYHRSKRYQQRQSFALQYHIKKGDSWVETTRHILNYARLHSTNIREYLDLVHNNGRYRIKANCIKCHTVNGVFQFHYYKKPSKKALYNYKIQNGKHKGEYLRLRPHFSYDIRYHGKHYKIRDKKLGSDFFTPNLLKQWYINERQQKLHPNTKVNQSASLNHPVQHSVKSPKSLAHQQSDGIQPHMIRGKKAVQANKDIASIKHSPKSTSVVKAQKLLKYAKHVHMGTFTVHGYTKRSTKTKSGKVIPLSNPVPVKARSFHFPVIRLPHKPSIPIFQFLGSKDTETVIAMNANLNILKMNQYRQQYDDYMSAKDARSEAIDTNRDMDAQTRQTNKDIAKNAHEKHNMLIKEIKANRGMSR